MSTRCVEFESARTWPTPRRESLARSGRDDQRSTGKTTTTTPVAALTKAVTSFKDTFVGLNGSLSRAPRTSHDMAKAHQRASQQRITGVKNTPADHEAPWRWSRPRKKLKRLQDPHADAARPFSEQAFATRSVALRLAGSVSRDQARRCSAEAGEGARKSAIPSLSAPIKRTCAAAYNTNLVQAGAGSHGGMAGQGRRHRTQPDWRKRRFVFQTLWRASELCRRLRTSVTRRIFRI